MRALAASLGLIGGIALTITIQRTWRHLVAELLARGDT